MKKWGLKLFLIFFIIFILFRFDSVQIKESAKYSIKIEKKVEQQIIDQDTKIIKQILLNFMEKKLNEANLVDKYLTNRTINNLSKELAVYYNQLVNFQDDPERTIKLVNEIIDNSQAYIEVAAIFLEQMEAKTLKSYNKIKDKYCTNWFENLIDSHDWKTKATVPELEEIYNLELELIEIQNLLKVINRIRMLFRFVDFTIYSNSPIAWGIRQYIGW